MSLALAGCFPNLPRVEPRPFIPPVAPPEPPPPPAEWATALIRSVCEDIAAAHGLTADVLLSRVRYEHVVRARDHAFAVIRWSTGLSLPEMGRIFYKDHTSILEAVRRHERLLNP